MNSQFTCEHLVCTFDVTIIMRHMWMIEIRLHLQGTPCSCDSACTHLACISLSCSFSACSILFPSLLFVCDICLVMLPKSSILFFFCYLCDMRRALIKDFLRLNRIDASDFKQLHQYIGIWSPLLYPHTISVL